MAEACFILTAAETRAAEEKLFATGMTVDALMARAGAAVAEAAWYFAGPIPALIVCGPGNNGGDGYVVAQELRSRGVPVRVAASGEPKTEAARAARAGWGGPVETLDQATPAPLLIDALFGTGLTRALDPAVEAALVRLADGARRKVAIDLPSGVATDSGAVLGRVPTFDLTVALGGLKPAHRLQPASSLCGRVAVADIGLDLGDARLVAIGRPRLTTPGPDAHKYSRGKVTVVAGAMPGAAWLAATAAQRAAGYVELVGGGQIGRPHALVQKRWSAGALDDPRIGAVVIGPGLGRDRRARGSLDAALASGKPLVLDADALSLIGRARHDRLAGHVLTPHMGEFERLFGAGEGDRLARARAAAAASGAIILLKGADSIVAHPDGRAAIAPLAPSWLASAGTGDVLAGIVGAMLAGGRAPFEACQAALWLHAEAAQLAGPALIADDLVTHLPGAIGKCL
jgi:hydroxyethylthiazole kinase-like uncharacterized protein yjeF